MIKILIVEDDLRQNQVLCNYLKNNHYEVTGCTNVNSALEVISRSAIDIIVSDIMMPELDGFDLAEAIRTQDKNIPILFASALDDMPSKQKGFRMGIDDYMVKPINLDELLLRLEALVRRANIANMAVLSIGGGDPKSR
ncbi:MAG: response regulator transcription factor [Suipraeoptans sp.]